MQSIGLITRCRDEPYVGEFASYYLSQGIDHIYIIDDDSRDPSIDACLLDCKRISIFRDANIIRKNSISSVYQKIRTRHDWLIYVDVDEYVATRGSNTIRFELETTFKDAACVKIPWVMMSCNSIDKNPKSLLETNVYRWNHDKRHVNTRSKDRKFRCRYDQIEVKCIFRPECFGDIWAHHPLLPANENLRVVESVDNTDDVLSPFYDNLRESSISRAHLLCYHYRIVSIEGCISKIRNNLWYANYTLGDLLSNDYPELIDDTLKNKVRQRNVWVDSGPSAGVEW